MLDGGFFEKLACVGARARADPRPFGGIQLVLCGDFFQLPPVGIGQKSGAVFCFEAPVWPSAVPTCVVLSTAFRQRDGDFVRVLNDVRTGAPSEQTLAALRATEERCRRDEAIAAALAAAAADDDDKGA
jgi:ATP-dependent DNA helicase PIF1